MPTSSTAVRSLVDRYRETRAFTLAICEPLETEDYIVQSMADVSPTRWHIAHTTWFFETFVLKPFCDSYESSNNAFEYLFNSYYNSVGSQYPRAKRGLLTRPTVKDVWAYREAVDRAIEGLLADECHADDPEFSKVMELGLQHEQQHQELMLTDIKHVLSCNPLFPVYRASETESHALPNVDWCEYEGGRRQFGYGGGGFHFDNEAPQFEQLLPDYALQDRLITNRGYLEFIQSRGYECAEHWLSMGWAAVEQENWKAPLYWFDMDGEWHEFTLNGLQKLDLDQPVCHISYFEADAMARWAGCRLPTELEWEHAAVGQAISGNFADTKRFHPTAINPSNGSNSPHQMYGDVWEWTASQYSAYPGYKPPAGALGEYNGKFMCNQFVLRGGSCATSEAHIRPTYRNFFPPHARWQFSGIRLAR